METQVVVIGGGITGAGILRDLAMRGVAAVLVEKGDLVNGTSARFHGLLHSGARYAAVDLPSARDCWQENQILKRIAAPCLADSGGVFVQLAGDDPTYAPNWLAGCRAAGIPVQERERQEFLRQEPGFSREVSRVFTVPDAAVDGFAIVRANALAARQLGAAVVTYGLVTGIDTAGGRIRSVTISRRGGREEIIHCQMVINAAGPWTGQVAALAGLELPVVLNKGALLVFNQRLSQRVINRCQTPGDGDILLPHHTVSIYGTTAANVAGPDTDGADSGEVARLLDIGRQLIPDLGKARILRAFAGVRPLYQSGSQADCAGRKISRDFTVIDHSCVDGLAGMISVVGGKFTTYRLMAEKAVDLAATQLGSSSPCRTAAVMLPNPHPLPAAVRTGEGTVICECEQVSEAELAAAIGGEDWINLSDLRRRTRLGMGTCQGTFCLYRALEMVMRLVPDRLNDGSLLREIIMERWQGMRPVLWGETLREAEMMRTIYGNLLNVEDLDDGQQV